MLTESTHERTTTEDTVAIGSSEQTRRTENNAGILACLLGRRPDSRLLVKLVPYLYQACEPGVRAPFVAVCHS